MGKTQKTRRFLFLMSLIILLLFLGAVIFFVFSSRRKARQLRLAEKLFELRTEESLDAASGLYKALLHEDSNLETAYVRLAEIAGHRCNYPESVYYWNHAQALNPLNRDYQKKYIGSLLKTREFSRLETYINSLSSPTDREKLLRLYAAFYNGNAPQYADEGRRLQKSAPDAPLFQLIQAVHRPIEFADLGQQSPLSKLSRSPDYFIRQESLLALADRQIRRRKLSQAEQTLQTAAAENFFAAAPSLGKFLATFKSFQEAIPVYRRYLDQFHDPLRAMQLAEIHTLLRDRQALRDLTRIYQTNPHRLDIYSCFYFQALLAFLDDDMKGVRENLAPVRNIIRYPLAVYMGLCADIRSGDHEAVLRSFTAFAGSRRYLDLHKRGGILTEQFISGELKAGRYSPELLQLAEQLHKFRPGPLTTQLQLLLLLRNRSLDDFRMEQALKKYPGNSGIWKIALSLSLQNAPARTPDLIAEFKKRFPKETESILDQEITSLIQNRRNQEASRLFRQHPSAERLPAYWDFAVRTRRREDLVHLLSLPQAALYHPFCQAELLMMDGRMPEALKLLAQAPAGGNQKLLFHAARTLGENRCYPEALKRYGEIPDDSPYAPVIQANCAEIHQELGHFKQALDLAEKAWQAFPDNPVLQQCYADKLLKQGLAQKIPAVVRLPDNSSEFRPELKKLWLDGIQALLEINLNQQKWQIMQEYLRLLQIYDPENPQIEAYRRQIPADRRLP